MKSPQYRVQIGEQLGNVEVGNTVLLFDGNVRISLIGISFEGDPLRHKVTAVVEALGKIEKVDVGQIIVFKGQEIAYEVRVFSVGTFLAQFLGIAKM